MKIIDISGVLENGMWSYEPPIPKVHIKRVASIDKIGWEAHQISFATISGTYLEASAHLIKGGVTRITKGSIVTNHQTVSPKINTVKPPKDNWGS